MLWTGPGGARGDDDLALDVEPLEVLGLALPDPDELGRDVGRGAARGQHGRQVGVGGDLLPAGLDLPELALDPVPGLAAGKAEDGRVGQPVFLEPVEDVLGLGERPGVLGGLAVARKAAHGHDVVEGRFAGGLADDLVHPGLGQERPLQPRRHLGGGRPGRRGGGGPGGGVEDRQIGFFWIMSGSPFTFIGALSC